MLHHSDTCEKKTNAHASNIVMVNQELILLIQENTSRKRLLRF